MEPTVKANRLIKEKSPYLLQHAYNPVDWYPWGEDAFARAKAEQKPVFLSVGYSTCHWCHVMERESFEDQEVAEILNDGFISVKVDREERPDLDSIYMNVCQAMTGSGGWPLTVFLTPDRKPFFAGTYFPKQSRYGRPGLIELLDLIAEKWEGDSDHLRGIGDDILNNIAEHIMASDPGEATSELMHDCYRSMKDSFDSLYGGFGNAPKFPTPHYLLFLLRYWKRFQEPHALEMVEKTLLGMYCGGIFDHLGLGFSRYSTDREWLVPHFEKMLYDNALTAIAYLEAYQVTHKEFYAGVARDIFTYILRDMTSPEGGFYTAEDADSEGVEGKFYLWTPQEIKDLLGEDDGEFFCTLYDITSEGNFEGGSIPNLLKQMLDESPVMGGDEEPLLDERVKALRQKLFATREKRIHPFKDDKILTSWNGLMIAALARGAWILVEKSYADAAEKAARFIFRNLRGQEGGLLARYREGEGAFPAYLDDYAFLSWGLLELYQATFAPEYLKEAVSLTKEMGELFWDEEQGGYFFTERDGDLLGIRPKEIGDLAMPSGNSVAAWNLLHLARLTGSGEFEENAQGQLHAFGGAVAKSPQSSTFYLLALDFALGPPQELVVAGERNDPGLREILKILRATYLPQMTILFNQQGKEGGELATVAPGVVDKLSRDGKPTIYLCENFSCQEPITDPEELIERLK